MDNVICDGTETELGLCRFDGWATSDCDSSEAAGVVCRQHHATAVAAVTPRPTVQPKTPVTPAPKRRLHHHQYHHASRQRQHGKHRPEFRLTGGRRPSEGRVEVRFGATAPWGTLCPNGWSLLEANVLCKSLGLGYAQEALQTDFFSTNADNAAGTAPPDLPILLSGTECYGNETSLHECLHQTRVSCGQRESAQIVAAVMCVQQMADLVFQHEDLEQTAHLEDRPLYFLQCAMEENCLASAAYAVQKDNPNWRQETRRLLKFTASVLNAGTDDFRPSIPKHQWEWHMCHM